MTVPRADKGRREGGGGIFGQFIESSVKKNTMVKMFHKVDKKEEKKGNLEHWISI